MDKKKVKEKLEKTVEDTENIEAAIDSLKVDETKDVPQMKHHKTHDKVEQVKADVKEAQLEPEKLPLDDLANESGAPVKEPGSDNLADLNAMYGTTLDAYQNSENHDVDFINSVENYDAYKEDQETPTVEKMKEEDPTLEEAKQKLAMTNQQVKGEMAHDVSMKNLLADDHEHKKVTDDFPYSYEWDEQSYQDFEQIYLYDFNQQIDRATKSNKFSLVLSTALIIFCAYMIARVLMGASPGPMTIYLIGIVIGLFSFWFVQQYPVSARNKAVANLKAFMNQHVFNLRFHGDQMDVGSQEDIDLRTYDNAVVYKDILLLISHKENNFIMINLKDNDEADHLLAFLKSKDYLQTSVETEPFSLNKYGIKPQR